MTTNNSARPTTGDTAREDVVAEQMHRDLARDDFADRLAAAHQLGPDQPPTPDQLAAFDTDRRARFEADYDDTHARWTPGQSETYLDTRPVGGPFDPTRDYGHPAWREPESQDEADARTAHLATQPSPPAPEVGGTETQEAYVDATVRGWHADLAHDPDPHAWAEADRLSALSDLTPLTRTQADAIDTEPESGPGPGPGPDRDDGPGRRSAALDIASYDAAMADPESEPEPEPEDEELEP